MQKRLCGVGIVHQKVRIKAKGAFIMDYCEKVKYLKSYRDKDDRLTFINNQLLGIKAISYTQGGAGGHKTTNEYLIEKEEIIDQMFVIEDLINQIPDTGAKTVLGYKYLQYLTFKEIAVKMNYSFTQIRRLHKRGIDLLNIL